MAILEWTGISYPFRIENGSVATSQSIVGSKDGASEHIGESIKQIVTTTIGEWITKGDIGSKFRKMTFNLFSDDFDAYIIFNLKDAIETQDPRIKVADINIERLKQENTLKVKVSWDISPEIVQNGGIGTYQTVVNYDNVA